MERQTSMTAQRESELDPLWTSLAREIESFLATVEGLPITPDITPRAMRAELEAAFSFQHPIPLEELSRRVMELMRTRSLHVTHPAYFGLYNPSVRRASIMGDALAALYNPQLAAWSHAPLANEIERLTLKCFSGLLGLDPESAFANFTSGGAEANLSATLVALAHLFPESSEKGVAALPARPAIYLTSESHHSFNKISRMSGLGTNAIREVAVDARFLMDAGALRARIRADRDEGYAPLLIVATAGTTSAGLIDPIEALLDVAREENAWLHVDAAFGGAAVLSPRLRPYLSGIERADSITWDAHKWLSVPMGAGMFFTPHRESVARAFGSAASYMPLAAGEESFDPYAMTAQWSRRATGLKVFMSLAELGVDGYRTLVERQTAMGDRLRELLREAGWTVVNETPLPVVCFTSERLERSSRDLRELVAGIQKRGRVWISEVLLGGRQRALRACITSFRTEERHLERLIEEIGIAMG